MVSTAFILQLLLSFIGGSTMGTLITFVMNRGKIKAQTSNIIGDTYGDLLAELRKQLDYQGGQIVIMQTREVELLKIISHHQIVENELRKKIENLKTELAKRITNLEANDK